MKKYLSIALRPAAFALLFLIASAQYSLLAQTAQQSLDPKLTVERIFASREFQPERFGGFEWLKDGDSYAKFEPSAKVKNADDLVRYRIDTGAKSVLLSAESRIPKGKTEPLELDGYD